MADLGMICRLVLAVVFGTAAISKLGNFSSFVRTVLRIGMPARLAAAFACIVIVCEALVSLLCLSPVPRVAAGVAALALVSVFTLVSVRELTLQRSIPCNCFGQGTGTLGWHSLNRSLLLLVPAGVLAFSAVFHGQETTWSADVPTALMAVSASLGVILLGRWIVVAPTAIGLTRDRIRAESCALTTGSQDVQNSHP